LKSEREPGQRIFGMPLSWAYRGDRATGFGRAASRFWAAWAALGLPPWRQVGLELTGRKTGRRHRLAVVIAEHEGQRYLVSMLGECEWVRNARAGGDAWIVTARRRKVRLEEIPVPARVPIIREYLRLAPGARPHIGLGKRASLEECARVAPRHPVFRIAEA
jgi:hypothetical protein